MSGNIKIPDILICPWISLLESNLFQLNVVFILKRFCTDHHYIPGFQNRITLWDEDAVITLDYCNNDSLWKIKFSNAVSDPFVVFVKADADKMYILLLSVFTDSLQARVLIDKSGGNNTGGDGNHTDTKKCDKYSENLAHGGDRINITIANCEQSGGGPPDSGKCVCKNFRLCFIFQTVHTEAGREHQN